MNRWAGCLEGNTTHQVEKQHERSQDDQQVGEEAAGMMMCYKIFSINYTCRDAGGGFQVRQRKLRLDIVQCFYKASACSHFMIALSYIVRYNYNIIGNIN